MYQLYCPQCCCLPKVTYICIHSLRGLDEERACRWYRKAAFRYRRYWFACRSMLQFPSSQLFSLAHQFLTHKRPTWIIGRTLNRDYTCGRIPCVGVGGTRRTSLSPFSVVTLSVYRASNCICPCMQPMHLGTRERVRSDTFLCFFSLSLQM